MKAFFQLFLFCCLPVFILTSSKPPLETPPEEDKIPIGLGMFAPNFYENAMVSFYGDPNLDKGVMEHMPWDSLTFHRTETGVTISYAPPWFVPEHMKMDYETLYLRVLTIHGDFIQVVVNKLTGRTAWMSRYDGNLQFWPGFLLSMNSVEQLDPDSNPVKIKPLDHASESTIPYEFLRPVGIRHSWIEVKLLDKDFKEKGSGWIKWQEDEELLITWSLFS